MKILYLCYWGAEDGLTHATVYPHLEIISNLDFVEKILFCTIERGAPGKGPRISEVEHIPLVSKDAGLNSLTKALDVTRLGRRVVKLVREEGVDAMVCRSSLAGAIALGAHLLTGTPFLVESFEPHADYATEAGGWSRLGAKSVFLRATQRVQTKLARGLMPVTDWYANALVRSGVPKSRIRVVPCGVPVDKFALDVEARQSIRQRLGFDGATVGIYVGKFGGLYLAEEAGRVFGHCFERIPDFRLMVLTPMAESPVRELLARAGIRPEHAFVGQVAHDEVPAYLSAADFAFGLYVGTPSMRACSPTKHGEYWANGLPVLMTRGVGDETDFLEAEGMGSLFDRRLDDLAEGVQKILGILADPSHRSRISGLAARFRSFDAARDAYMYFLSQPSVGMRPPTAPPGEET